MRISVICVAFGLTLLTTLSFASETPRSVYSKLREIDDESFSVLDAAESATRLEIHKYIYDFSIIKNRYESVIRRIKTVNNKNNDDKYPIYKDFRWSCLDIYAGNRVWRSKNIIDYMKLWVDDKYDVYGPSLLESISDYRSFEMDQKCASALQK